MFPPELFFLAQICTKSFSGWGFAPDPIEGAHSAPQTRKGEAKGGGRGGEGIEKERGERGEGKGDCLKLSLATPLSINGAPTRMGAEDLFLSSLPALINNSKTV